MSQSLANVLIHLVFSTKERRPLLRDLAIREETHRYLGGISKKLECPPVITGGVEDHVHILARMARTITLADWVKELKRASSVWIKTKGNDYNDFQWQAGYGVFSVSQSNSVEVEQYIAGQPAHHRESTFQEEYRRLLVRHGIQFDEKYVWD